MNLPFAELAVSSGQEALAVTDETTAAAGHFCEGSELLEADGPVAIRESILIAVNTRKPYPVIGMNLIHSSPRQ